MKDHTIYWADAVTTPEGYVGTVTQFEGDKAKVVFNEFDPAPLSTAHRWYERQELTVGHTI